MKEGQDATISAYLDGGGVPEECSPQDNTVEEVPEVFEMPPAPTRRVLGRVRHVGPAPFTFVDE